jgi:hypothetical protein
MFTLKSTTLLFLLVLAASLPSFAETGGSVPVLELVRGGLALPEGRRQVFEQAILEEADATGVVLCRDGGSLSRPGSAALDRICAAPNLPRLWWDAEVEAEKTGDVEVLDVLVKVAIGNPSADGPQSIFAPHVLLPAGVAGPEWEGAVLAGIHRSLLATDELRVWLASLKSRPQLLRARPAEAGPPAGEAAGPARHRPASPEEARAWDAELRQITDLLIDGHFLEARGRAARLLREDLTPEVAGRTRELLAKADAKLARVGSSGPGERGQIEIRPARPTPPTPAAPAERKRWERSFEVRVARDDRGFGNGIDGRLVVSEEGVAFTRKGENRSAWAISWSDLAAAHRAEGIWDVPYPLAFAEKGGRLHHLVRIDAEGKPLPGGAILSALAEGRLASRKGYS